MISRNPGMRVVVNALFESVPNVVNVFILVMIAMLIFAIIGVNYFKGALRHCAGPGFDALNEPQKLLIRSPVPFVQVANVPAIVSEPTLSGRNNSFVLPSKFGYNGTTSRAVCEWLLPPSVDEPWRNPWRQISPMHFDTLESAIVVLYQICAKEGWAGLMWNAVDSTGISMQPIKNNNRAVMFLFMTMVAIGSVFMMNLFVGVVIHNFDKLREEHDGKSVLLTPEQQQWIRLQEMMLRSIAR
eukprot:g7705.t1